MYRGEKVAAIIVAAGESRRMNGQNKLLMMLAGKPILTYVLEIFIRSPLIDQVIVSINKTESEQLLNLINSFKQNDKILTCVGGPRRQDSVAAALALVDGCNWVIIHDGARPMVTQNLIEEGLAAAEETGAAIAAVPVIDTIKLVGKNHLVERTLPRDQLWSVQTPQVFRYNLILQAHRCVSHDVTDDAMMIEEIGESIKVFHGSYSNIKITTPEDLIIAECLIQKYGK